MNIIVRIIYFGNVFYGLCAVALCIETNLLLGLSINHFPFYLLIFFGSWIYYTMIYIRSTQARANKVINQWYRVNLPAVKAVLYCILVLEGLLVLFLFFYHFNAIKNVSALQWLLMSTVPLAGGLYTFNLPFAFARRLRQIGWLKPFIIGITWAGWVTIFPVVVWQIQYAAPGETILPGLLLYLVNFLFISALAIIFDVKDFLVDVKKRLQTIPAMLGIDNSYRLVILPITLLCMGIYYAFQLQQAFTFAQVFLQMIPLLLLLAAVIRPFRGQHIFYYLVVIDGLMMLKAICGIISIKFL